MRGIRLDRSFYVPKRAAKLTAKGTDATVYLYTDEKGRPCARAFAGKGTKPVWSLYFRSEADRELRIRQLFDGQRVRTEGRAAEGAKRRAFRNPYKPGDIFRASWGYDQTNVDWYQVTAVRGADLILRKIASDRGESDGWAGKCVPLPGQFVGEPIRKRAQEGGIRIESYIWASYVAPKMVAGVPVYDSTYWSAYA